MNHKDGPTRSVEGGLLALGTTRSFNICITVFQELGQQACLKQNVTLPIHIDYF